MQVGLLTVLSNRDRDEMSDAVMYLKELELAERAEALGFDSIWLPEHHFDGAYSMCPDNMQVLAYLASRTSTIKLATGAVILPWNDPLRVVEKITLLDILTEGRVIFGMGRGLAKKEYEAFRIDMSESRERFDEASRMILEGLRTGFVEGHGKFYEQPRVEVRPSPPRDFEGRLFSVGMSPDSLKTAAELGVAMMSFVQFPIERHAESIEEYRTMFREHHPGKTPPAPLLTDFTYCHEDPDEAEAGARKYLGDFFGAIVRHYDWMDDHWASTEGYQSYEESAAMMREAGLEAAQQAFVDSQIWGTPEQMVEQYRERVDLIGDLYTTLCVVCGGMPYDKAHASLKLIGEQVLPELKKMGVAVAPA